MRTDGRNWENAGPGDFNVTPYRVGGDVANSLLVSLFLSALMPTLGDHTQYCQMYAHLIGSNEPDLAGVRNLRDRLFSCLERIVGQPDLAYQDDFWKQDELKVR